MATLLISPARLIKDTAFNGSLDQNLAAPYILVAQDREIWPWLGTDLYDKLKADVEGDSLTGNYLTLVKDYIQPALTHFAFNEILPFLRVRLVNNAVQIMSSEQSTSATASDIKPLQDRAQAIASFYRERMVEYLCHNTGLFPEYSSNTGADLTPRKTNYTGGMNLNNVYTKKQEQYLRDAGLMR